MLYRDEMTMRSLCPCITGHRDQSVYHHSTDVMGWSELFISSAIYTMTDNLK